MAIHSTDIVTVPSVELQLDSIADRAAHVARLFDALAEEEGDMNRQIGRRMMRVDGITAIRLFAMDDVDWNKPILELAVPADGMTMAMVEDLCDVALTHEAYRREQDKAPFYGAWDHILSGTAAHIRPSDVMDN